MWNVAESWQHRAACRGQDAAYFFAPNYFERRSEKNAREAVAKSFCARCPVRQECLEYALATREGHGIWGGLNEMERRRLLRERARRELTSAVRPAPAAPGGPPPLSSCPNRARMRPWTTRGSSTASPSWVSSCRRRRPPWPRTFPCACPHGLAFVAGQVPMIDGAAMFPGRLGDPGNRRRSRAGRGRRQARSVAGPLGLA